MKAELKFWLGTEQFAAGVGVTDRAARKIFSKASVGKTWRGATLEVRAVHGQGGHGGSHFQVSVGSLPSDTRAQFSGRPLQSEMPLNGLSSPSKNWKEALILTVIAAGPAKSKERGEMITALSLHAEHQSGKRAGQHVAAKTLRGWVAGYEAKGLTGIQRPRRADRGKARTLVSRAWDAGNGGSWGR